MKNSAIGRSWDEVEKELCTPEEIEKSDLRVSAVGKLINLRDNRKITQKFYENMADNDEGLEIIGEFIKARREKELTQKELETLTGINQVNISKIEKMSTSPRIDTMRRLLKPLGYTLAIIPIENSKKRA
jgi:DNA-binding XRE family transcriptional regulator